MYLTEEKFYEEMKVMRSDLEGQIAALAASTYKLFVEFEKRILAHFDSAIKQIERNIGALMEDNQHKLEAMGEMIDLKAEMQDRKYEDRFVNLERTTKFLGQGLLKLESKVKTLKKKSK
jgi:hypothetical protein